MTFFRGVRGRLITTSFARDVLPDLPGATSGPSSFHHAFAVWSERYDPVIGPASSVRAIADVVVAPLLEILGYTVATRTDGASNCWIQTSDGVGVVIVGWNELLGRVWRSSVLHAISADARWCLCCNGRELRIVDGHRTWAREYLEFDLLQLRLDGDARNLLWAVARADAMSGPESVLDRAVDLSARHGVEVCRALGVGVLEGLRLLFEALATSPRVVHPPRLVFEHSLTVLYRVLFLLFAEARRLVPVWHPVYRDRYSLDVIVAELLGGRPCRGLWQAINAISRLAHAGCSAGELRVTAFNGRLFAPSHAAVFESTRIDDVVMGRAVVSVSTTVVGRRSPARIMYRDLDVEELGAVYERVLEYEPLVGPGAIRLDRTGDARKSTGAFYTPKPVTAHLVRRTLEPLVRDRRSDDILNLRVLDPAMGSGAFLVATCRYLASAVEDALIREGRWHVGDVTTADRAVLRRDIASRCLFGVDLNPMAVQLARLSLWLATLAAEKPLSFLDHHLVSGDSLIGATPDDLRRQPTRGAGPGRRPEALPLFGDASLATTLEQAVRIRLKLTREADASATIVRAKEETLTALRAAGTPLSRWMQALDLWCAGWFWPEGSAPDRATFHALRDRILTGTSALPDHIADSMVANVDEVARRHRFLHWTLTFPEVFVDERGDASPSHGFDAVVGNPPWDMVRGDSGDAKVRGDRKRDARQILDFVRGAGIYTVESRAHVNRYQLFVERALQLVRPGGRVGFVLPSGAISDAGTAPLRRHVFDRASVDAITGLDNRGGIFPIHRSLRFVLLSCTAGSPTTAIECRFGLSRAEDLETDVRRNRAPMTLTRKFLARLSGEDDLGVPELVDEFDRRIVEKISASVPWLSTERGWNARFGRELNASDDRGAFTRFTGDSRRRPVIEGKQIDAFRVRLDACRFEMTDSPHSRLRVPRRARLAYRDVASATNRLTLIAAVVPPEAVTTHTLFCLKNPSPAAEQRVLCALLNSFVANYLIRLRVHTHVTVALVSRLPTPVVRLGHPLFPRLASLAGSLMASTSSVEEMPEYAELQAIAARLYGLTEDEFEHVLSTFPLVASNAKTSALSRFRNNDP